MLKLMLTMCHFDRSFYIFSSLTVDENGLFYIYYSYCYFWHQSILIQQGIFFCQLKQVYLVPTAENSNDKTPRSRKKRNLKDEAKNYYLYLKNQIE